MNMFREVFVILVITLMGAQILHAQAVELPKDGNVTAEWIESLPEGSHPLCVVPTDFSKPPRLLIQDLEYVTTKSRHGSPAWSKDGSKIAFDCQPADGDLNKGRIITCDVDGTDVRDVGLGLMPNWSPAGTRLAFSTYEAPGYVCTINADGTDRQVIPGAENGWGTQWSPDGLSVAYYLWRDGCELMVYDRVKKEGRSVIPAEENPYRQIYWNFAWSPDSQKIAICGVRKNDGLKETALVSVTPGNVERQVLKSFYRDTYYLDYHPNGNQLVYDEAGCIMSFDLTRQDATPQLLQGQSPDFGYSNPAVSPNGKWIAVGLR